MTDHFSDLAKTAAELREAFDRGFAEPARADQGAQEALIAIRIAGRPFAFPARELSSIVKDTPITPFPSSSPGFLGMAGVRATIVPVYSLQVLLALDGAGVRGSGWLGISGVPAVGLVFDELVRFVQVDGDSPVAARSVSAAAPFVDRVITIEGTLHGIINIQSLVEHITAGHLFAVPKEQ